MAENGAPKAEIGRGAKSNLLLSHSSGEQSTFSTGGNGPFPVHFVRETEIDACVVKNQQIFDVCPTDSPAPADKHDSSLRS
jgi:hypothetical protein